MFKMVSLAQLPELASHLVEPRIEEPSLVPEITVSNLYFLVVWCLVHVYIIAGVRNRKSLQENHKVMFEGSNLKILEFLT